MAYATILLEEDNGITRLTLNRPQSLNALTMEMVNEIIHAVDALYAGGTTRVLLITGAGRGFSSGADLGGDVIGDLAGPRDAGISLESHFNPLLQRFFAAPFPIVTAINGPAAGAGCSLALAGDIVIAARSAFFLQAFINVALVPDVGSTWLLPRAIGRARATGMMMLGEKLPAATAADWGLIWKAVDDASLAEEAQKICQKMAAGPTKSYAIMRQGIKRALETTLTETLHDERINQRDASRTDDFLEGVTAFMEKRKANFSGG
jgi:2-(1,2-epoxy-1,2-dihydrophenyl)acetyl-CoA isomerase